MQDLYQKSNKKELFLSDMLMRYLEEYGAIQWHKNKNHSFYIKFKDVRLGSIRIANHKGKEKYHYTYEIYTNDKDIERKIHDTIESIITKSKSIQDFDPKKYIVFDRDIWKYVEVSTYENYKQSIWKK
jgi:hypothetical protein